MQRQATGVPGSAGILPGEAAAGETPAPLVRNLIQAAPLAIVLNNPPNNFINKNHAAKEVVLWQRDEPRSSGIRGS